MPEIQYAANTATTGVRVVTWEHVTQDDTCQAVACPQYDDKSIQVHGAFGKGGKVVIEGTNEVLGAENFVPLHDARGGTHTLSFVSADLRPILGNCYRIRPRVWGGSGVDLTIVLLVATPTSYSNADL